jgi:hypothetical protein
VREHLDIEGFIKDLELVCSEPRTWSDSFFDARGQAHTERFSSCDGASGHGAFNQGRKAYWHYMPLVWVIQKSQGKITSKRVTKNVT